MVPASLLPTAIVVVLFLYGLVDICCLLVVGYIDYVVVLVVVLILYRLLISMLDVVDVSGRIVVVMILSCCCQCSGIVEFFVVLIESMLLTIAGPYVGLISHRWRGLYQLPGPRPPSVATEGPAVRARPPYVQS